VLPPSLGTFNEFNINDVTKEVNVQLGAKKPGFFTLEVPSSYEKLQLASPDWLAEGQKTGFLDDPLNPYLRRLLNAEYRYK
jgi:hypothetical protein